MKKAFIFLLAVLSTLQGELFRVTEIFPGINVYVFQHKYVVKVSEKIPHINLGDYLNFNLDDFLTKDSWDQTLKIRHRFELDEHVYTYKAIGVVEKAPFSLHDFSSYVLSWQEGDWVKEYTEIDVQENWIQTNNAFTASSYEKADDKSMQWLLNTYRNYSLTFDHSILPIYDKNDETKLVGVMNHALKRKFFSHDHKYTFALIGDDE